MIGNRPLRIPNKILTPKTDAQYREDMETIERYINGLSVVIPTPSGIQWESVTIPDSDWDTADAVGTWSVTPAGISQSGVSAGTGLIYTTSDYLGLAWAVQADITVPADHPGGIAGLYAGFQKSQCVAGVQLDNCDNYTDMGVSQSDTSGTMVPAGFTPETYYLGTTALTLDNTYTLQAIYFSQELFVKLAGALEGHIASPSLTTPLNVLGIDSRFLLMTRWFNGTTATKMDATFANVKAWRIPVPVLT